MRGFIDNLMYSTTQRARKQRARTEGRKKEEHRVINLE